VGLRVRGLFGFDDQELFDLPSLALNFGCLLFFNLVV
jgi:hypothetical protein